MTTVAMKPTPSARAMSLRRFFSSMMLREYVVEEASSSEVIRSMIAVAASQRLMSDSVSGKCMLLNSLGGCT